MEDDGADGMPDVEGHGIGIANTRARLLALYGPEAMLSIETTESGGTRVGLRLPRKHAVVMAVRDDTAAHAFHLDQVALP